MRSTTDEVSKHGPQQDASARRDAAQCDPPEDLAAGVRRRVRAALPGRSARLIAAETGFSAETVRRYLTRTACSVEFLAALCDRYGLSAEWLLFERGSPRLEGQRDAMLASASTERVLAEIARRWELLEASVAAGTHPADTTHRAISVRAGSRQAHAAVAALAGSGLRG